MQAPNWHVRTAPPLRWTWLPSTALPAPLAFCTMLTVFGGGGSGFGVLGFETVLLCIPGWPITHLVAQVGLPPEGWA